MSISIILRQRGPFRATTRHIHLLDLRGPCHHGILISSPLLAIFLIVAVDVLGLTIMIPLLPFYAEKLLATPTQVGWLVGIYAACQLISGPLLGRLSDHMGRKPLLLVSQAGTFIGFLVTAYAPTLWILF